MKWGLAFILLPAALSLMAGARAAEPDAVTVPVLAEPKLTFDDPEFETVYSEAMREQDQTLSRRFVQSLLRPAYTFESQYARWTVPVCPHVYGLEPVVSYMLERHIRDVARRIGAPVAAENCAYNVSIIVTPDPQASLESLIKSSPWLLMGNPMKEWAIRAPIQAWYAGGVRDYAGGTRAMADWDQAGMDRPPMMQANDSRLRTGVHPIMGAITVLVDAKAILGLQLGTFGDYVAMLSLVQTRNNGACQPAPSIANLMLEKCDAEHHVSRLSDADLALLTGIYQVPLEPEMIQKPRIIGSMRKMLEVSFRARQN